MSKEDSRKALTFSVLSTSMFDCTGLTTQFDKFRILGTLRPYQSKQQWIPPLLEGGKKGQEEIKHMYGFWESEDFYRSLRTVFQRINGKNLGVKCVSGITSLYILAAKKNKYNPFKSKERWSNISEIINNNLKNGKRGDGKSNSHN